MDIYYGYERDPRNRFWADGQATSKDGVWEAECPVCDLDEPLFAFANVYYKLGQDLHRPGDPAIFALSVADAAYPDDLRNAKVKATERPRRLIDDFSRGFHDWYTLSIQNRHHWLLSTRKLADPRWEAPRGAKLSFEVAPTEAGNTLAVELKTDSWRGYRGRKADTWTAMVSLAKAGRQRLELASRDFKNPDAKPLNDWYGITELILQPGSKSKHSADSIMPWQGDVPRFFDLRWSGGTPVKRRKPFLPSSAANGSLNDVEFQGAIEDSVQREKIDVELRKSAR